MPLPTHGESVQPKTVAERSDNRCHCEERSDVAISWWIVRIRTLYQEIATPLRARNDTVTFGWSF